MLDRTGRLLLWHIGAVEAPRLPRTLDDLEDWSVYADHLLTIGDPFGERIVADLALPAIRDAEQLRPFRALVGRHTPSSLTMLRSWCLGMIRTLELRSRDSAGMFYLEQGSLAHARDVLRSRAASRLEELIIPTPKSEDTHYRRLLTALPASCTRVTITDLRSNTDAVEFFLDCLPPTVTELGLRLFKWSKAVTCVVRDRFDVVDVAVDRKTDELDDLVPALAFTRTVRVRIGSFHGVPPPRFELGGPDDAAVVALDPRPGRNVLGQLVPIEARMAWTLPRERAPVVVLPVRELLAAETDVKSVCLDPDPRVEHPRMTLVRRNGEWTAKSWAPLAIDEQEVPLKTVVPIRDGTRFEIGGRRGVFFSRDIDAQCRALL